MKHRCNTCGIRAGCLKRSLLIFFLYIVTGRSRELTQEIKDNISVEDDCCDWVPIPGNSNPEEASHAEAN